jgi:hypothetical protein
MITRIILAAVLAVGAAGAALADVKVNTPGVDVKAPSGQVEIDVDVGSKPSDAWIGRAVYSSDGKHLGEVAAIAGDQVLIDIGGFLGLGETRVSLDDDQIATVTNNRIDLKITEAEANSLPAADAKEAAPQ